jgi:hypothetical protein
MKHIARLLFTLICVASLSLDGCKSKPRNPFPASNEISGWQKTGETRTFAAQDLWQYIDGDAEQYLQAGVVTTSTADYKYNQLEAVVDIHNMKESAGARRILENSRGAEARSEKIGDGGFAWSQSIVFCKGPHLIRIVAWQSTPDTPQALLALARGVEAKL